MTDAKIIEELQNKCSKLEGKLQVLDEKLADPALAEGSIVVKKIRGKLYYYFQHRQGKQVVSDYIATVAPGVTAQLECNLMQRDELLQQRKALMERLMAYQEAIAAISREASQSKTNFSFEVFWKNELVSRVHVNGSKVHVSRYVEHPLKQIFCSDSMNRFALGEIMRMRCWDPNRADNDAIIAYLGLKSADALSIVRKTHGVMANDFIWFRFPGERQADYRQIIRR